VPAVDRSSDSDDPDWTAFAALDRMTNHWDRPGWRPGRAAYYWYVSFRDQPEVQALAERCQAVVNAPYFDLIARTDLHMTVKRVAFTDQMDESGLLYVEDAARRALHSFGELRFEVGPLAGSRGALSFSTAPQNRFLELRSRLSSTTHPAEFATDASPADAFRPHVGIGYCNRTVDASPIIEQVQKLRSLPPVNVCISELTLVELTRHERSYTWDIVATVPLTHDD
jgi:2'-5' RNA ligase